MEDQPIAPPVNDGHGLVFRAIGDGFVAIVTAPFRWLQLRTWRATVNLALWLALTCAIVVVSLAGWIASSIDWRSPGPGDTVIAGITRALAALVGLDRERRARFSGVRVDGPRLPQLRHSASPAERRRAWAEPTLLRRLPSSELRCAPAVTVLGLASVAWWWGTADRVVFAVQRVVLRYPWYYAPVGEKILAVIVAAIGLVLWPTVVRVVPVVDATLARRLVGPSSSELSQEVDRLSETRAQAVAAAADERRRIERDLHDGFQPQLVNLALDLGLARSRLASDPDSVGELLDRAHAQAKQASQDLRNLVRGIHPSVLDERGLDAAFSALAADSGVRLQIDVHLDRRPPRQAEGIAYFVVAEAITNVNKHAGAQVATITVSEIDGALRVLVQDDGRGGARSEPGGGLAGLAARIAGVDGRFSVTSPEGGPTWIEARIPCER